MEGLILFLIIAATLIILSRISTSYNKLDNLMNKISDLQRDIRQLSGKISGLEKQIHSVNIDKQGTRQETFKEPEKAEEPENLRTLEEIEALLWKSKVPEIQESGEEMSVNESEPIPADIRTTEPLEQVLHTTPFLKIPEPEIHNINAERKTEEAVKEKNTDIEKYIGENVVNKIGIGILVIGIGFFVKYAIDKNWINETFRTLIGIGCGALLIGIGHRMHKKFKAFSSVLFGGGLAVCYLTISIAFHQYHLFTQPMAFAIMVVITCFAVALSLMYDRKEIAVIAVLGGFGTPLFLSNGEGNYIILFSYLLILNVGMMVLASVRKWLLLNIICYVCTALIFGAWFTDYDFSMHLQTYWGAFFFVSAFYVTFFMMSILYNLRQKEKFTGIDYSILLSNSFLYYWVGMTIFQHNDQGKYEGLFTAAISLFNLIFAFILFRNKTIDRGFVFLLIGLVIAFISLTGPVQLRGHYITMYWATQAVLMLWLSQKTEIRLLKDGSVLISALMLLSLVMDWMDIYGGYSVMHLDVIINKGFVTGTFAMLSIFIAGKIAGSDKSKNIIWISMVDYTTGMKILFVLLLYLVPLFEIVHQVKFYAHNASFGNMMISLYNFLAVMAFIFYSGFRKNKHLMLLGTMLGFLSVILYMIIYREYQSLVPHHFIPFYLVHAPVIAVVGIIIYKSLKNSLVLAGNEAWIKNMIYTFICFSIVFIASNELYNFVFCLYDMPYLSEFAIAGNIEKIGYPIVWGICAFLFMRTGMVDKNRTLRVISLSLLLFTVIKLFVYDIRNASEIGKIIAFICLGILLLIISFMYQRIKALIFKDDEIVSEQKPENAGSNNNLTNNL